MIDLGLPNYYLIDTQPEARLSPGMVTEACKQIKRNRLQYAREITTCLLYTSPSPRDGLLSRMPSSA